MRNGRLRVLHVVLDLHAGGLERLVAGLLRGLDTARFEPHLLALDYLGRQAHGLDAAARLHVARSRGGWSLLWPRRLTSVIRGIAPDVVHSHSGVWFKASLAARRAGVPRLIHTDHGRRQPDPWIDRRLDTIAAWRTDVVVAVSEALARHLAGDIVRETAKLRVVPGGVDTEWFRPGPDTGVLRARLGVSPARPLLTTIGRLDRVKAYGVMLAAFATLLGTWEHGELPLLIIAGEGPEGPSLKAQAHSLGIADAVRFIGWHEDVRNLHSASALFTLSSWSEGTSLGLLEAMSAGLCPVVTAVGGNPVVLGSELAHRMVAPGSPEALVAAWREALADPTRRAADGARARRRVERVFSLRHMVHTYEGLYRGEQSA
jgi:glycosyltransferase involved in cell wall biosynthesis